MNCVRRVILDQAKVFAGSGKFDLARPDGVALAAEDVAVKRWADIYRGTSDVGLVSRLKNTDQWTLLFNTCIAEVVPDAKLRMPRIYLHPPHQVWVALDPFHPTDLQRARGVLLEVASESGLEQVGGGARDMKERRFMYYSARTDPPSAFLIDGTGDLVQSEDNPDDLMPYRNAAGEPVLPLVPFFEHIEELGFYCAQGQDLFDWQRSFNLSLTDVHNIAELQGFGELIFESQPGASKEQPQIVRGPTRANQLPPGVSAKVLSYSPMLRELIDLMREDVTRFMLLRGLPPGRVMAESRGVASGDALEIEERPLAEGRLDRVDLFRPRVAQLFDVLRMVNNYAYPDQPIDPALTLSWSPGELERPRDKEKEVRVQQARISLGLTNPVEIIQHERGVSEAQAQEIYARNSTMAREAVAARLAATQAVVGARTPPPTLSPGGNGKPVEAVQAAASESPAEGAPAGE